MSATITGTPDFFSSSSTDILSLISVSPPPSHRKPPERSAMAWATKIGILVSSSYGEAKKSGVTPLCPYPDMESETDSSQTLKLKALLEAFLSGTLVCW